MVEDLTRARNRLPKFLLRHSRINRGGSNWTIRHERWLSGLTCSENSTGLSEHRGAITRAGNSHIRAQLCEAAWSYQHRPGLGPTIRGRQDGASPATIARSWTAQTRLSKRFATLAARKNVKSVVAAAVARELAGFLWAEMNAND